MISMNKLEKYLEINEDKNTMIQNLWDAAKIVPRGKFIAIQAYLWKWEESHTNNLTLHLKEVEKEQAKPQIINSKRKQIINIRAEINRGLKKKQKRSMKLRGAFSKGYKKIDRLWASLIKKKRDRTNRIYPRDARMVQCQQIDGCDAPH